MFEISKKVTEDPLDDKEVETCHLSFNFNQEEKGIASKSHFLAIFCGDLP